MKGRVPLSIFDGCLSTFVHFMAMFMSVSRRSTLAMYIYVVNYGICRTALQGISMIFKSKIVI